MRKAGGGFGPGNPKYDVPLRPDMTYAEFKSRLDPSDAALLDRAKGNPSAAKALKERLGWTEKHNEISRPYENMRRNVDRGLGGQLQGGTNKNAGRAHQALSQARREAGGSAEAAPETVAPAPTEPEGAASEPVPASRPVVEPSKPAAPAGKAGARAVDGGAVDTSSPVGKPANEAANERKSPPVSRVKLPSDLSKISPRYGYRDANFPLRFESDFDRGAYALANKGTKSKAHTRILDALMQQTGKSEAEIVAHGQKVRAAVKDQARDNYDVPFATKDGLKVPAMDPKLSATAPADFTEADFADAPRAEPLFASPAHEAAVALGDELGRSIEVAHLPETVEGAYNPRDGGILLAADLAEADVARVLGHELTHGAIDALPPAMRARLVAEVRSQIGDERADELIQQAEKKWGELGEEALLHEVLADAGGSIVNRRGISWLQQDQSVWKKISAWLDSQVTKLRAALGSADAKMQRIAESIIHDYGNTTSTAQQNAANLAYETEFKGDTDLAIKFAIRDFAATNNKFMASSQKKLEKVFKPFGAAGAEIAKMGAQIVRRIMSPSYFAGKFPAFNQVFSANRAREENQIRIIDQVNKLTPEFQKLSEKDVAPVNAILDFQSINRVELTRQQLQGRGLTDTQIDAVMEVRAATKFMMDERRDALAYAFGQPPGTTAAAARALAAAATNPTEKARMNLLGDFLDKHDSLVKPGYIPRMRFGEHRKLVVADIATGAVLHYDHAASEAEFQEKLKALKQQWGAMATGPNAVVNLDTNLITDRADTESYGFSESDVVAMAKAAGVNPQILTDFLDGGVRDHLMAKGFNRHLLPSNDTPGYSTNFQRALASYALSASHGISLIKFNADIKQPMQAMATSDQALHQYATKYKDYVLNRQDYDGWLRNLAFMKYLGFNAGSAVTNLTQVPMVTAPFMFALSGKPGAVAGAWQQSMESVAAAAAEIGGNAALALQLKNPDLDMVELYADHVAKKDPQLAAALRAARANGIMTQADARAFTAMAQRGGNSRAGKIGRGFANAAAFFFAKSERAVRLATFVAAHKLATQSPAGSQFWSRAAKLGFNGAAGDNAAMAAWTVDETQGVYGKANRPELFRHWSTAPAYIFKQFAQTVLTAGYKMLKLGLDEARRGDVMNAPLGAVLAYFVQSMIAGGIWNALPGGQTFKGMANAIWSSHGGKRDLEVELDKIMGEVGGELLNRGALGFLPGPLGEYGPALGRRAGLGNAIPALNDAEAIAGPGISAIVDTVGDIGLITSGDPWAQAKGVADLTFGRTGKGVVDAVKAGTSSRGIETESGRTLIPEDEVDGTDIAGLALGLPTRHVDEAKRANKAIIDVKAGAGDKLQSLANRHVDALLDGDKDAIAEAMAALTEHNKQARLSGRTNELIAPTSYQTAIKNEMAQRRAGVMNNRGMPKKAYQQIRELRKSSARYQTADEASE